MKMEYSSTAPRRFDFSKAERRFDHQAFAGSISNLEDGNTIELPHLKPQTIIMFFKQLHAPAGLNATFSYPDSLIPAFTFATAIGDTKLQNQIISRIYNAVQDHHTTSDDDTSEILAAGLAKATRWAYNEKSILRSPFVMCMAWTATSRFEIGKDKVPHLDLDGCFEATHAFEQQEWNGKFWLEYVRQWEMLYEHNERTRQWHMVPVGGFKLPEASVVASLDD
jgi:hypothetical protein